MVCIEIFGFPYFSLLTYQWCCFFHFKCSVISTEKYCYPHEYFCCWFASNLFCLFSYKLFSHPILDVNSNFFCLCFFPLNKHAFHIMIEVRCIDVCSWLWNFLWTCKKLFWYEFRSFNILDQKFVSMRGWKTEIQSYDCSGYGVTRLQGAMWNTPGMLQPVPQPARRSPVSGAGLCWEGRRCEQPLPHCRAAACPAQHWAVPCSTGLPAVAGRRGSCVRNRGVWLEERG